MKNKKLAASAVLLALSFAFTSCTPTEYHNVTVYEYAPKKVAKAPSDNPRTFTPVGLGTGR